MTVMDSESTHHLTATPFTEMKEFGEGSVYVFLRSPAAILEIKTACLPRPAAWIHMGHNVALAVRPTLRSKVKQLHNGVPWNFIGTHMVTKGWILLTFLILTLLLLGQWQTFSEWNVATTFRYIAIRFGLEIYLGIFSNCLHNTAWHWTPSTDQNFPLSET